MTAVTITDEPINGWLLTDVHRVWSLGTAPEWFCAMMRVGDGAVVSYQSPAGVAQAVEGCSRKAREAETENNDDGHRR